MLLVYGCIQMTFLTDVSPQCRVMNLLHICAPGLHCHVGSEVATVLLFLLLFLTRHSFYAFRIIQCKLLLPQSVYFSLTHSDQLDSRQTVQLVCGRLCETIIRFDHSKFR